MTDCNYCTADKLCYYHAKIEAGLIEEPEPITEKEQGMDWREYANSIAEFRGWIDPRDAIFRNNENVIRSVVDKFAQRDTTKWDDLYSVALLGAGKAFDSWNPDKGTFANYLFTCCRNTIISELRKMERWDNETPIADTDLEYENTDEYEEALWQQRSFSPEEQYIREEELTAAHERVMEIVVDLTEREQYVLFNHILDDEPESLDAIAERYETSKTSIFRDKQRVLAHLKLEEESI
jgi:RNA polymerase sigma factor (sigma-70 family)